MKLNEEVKSQDGKNSPPYTYPWEMHALSLFSLDWPMDRVEWTLHHITRAFIGQLSSTKTYQKCA